MRIGAFLTRWVEVLAALLFSWREAWRARRSLVVSREGAGFVIRQAGAESDRPLATAAVGTPSPRMWRMPRARAWSSWSCPPRKPLPGKSVSPPKRESFCRELFVIRSTKSRRGKPMRPYTVLLPRPVATMPARSTCR